MKMKKFLGMLMLAGAVAATATSCDNEESDYDKGKTDGKAACDCFLNLLTTTMPTESEMEACYAKIDEAKYDSNKEYARGVDEGGKACKEAVDETDIIGNYSGKIDVNVGVPMSFDTTGWMILPTASADTFQVITDELSVQMGPASIPLVISLKVSNAAVVADSIVFTIPVQATPTAVGLLSIAPAGRGVYYPSTQKMTVNASGTMTMPTGLPEPAPATTDVLFSVTLNGIQE